MQEYVLGLDCGINVGCQDPLLLRFKDPKSVANLILSAYLDPSQAQVLPWGAQKLE